jgi:hypothetical protein
MFKKTDFIDMFSQDSESTPPSAWISYSYRLQHQTVLMMENDPLDGISITESYMRKVINAFLPLYATTLLMLLGSGLLTTYVSLRLAHEQVNGALIGAITAANYVGLVIGGKVGHNLIARVGHIRSYVTCAGIITASVIAHGLTDLIPLWVFLRLIIGLCMMCQNQYINLLI